MDDTEASEITNLYQILDDGTTSKCLSEVYKTNMLCRENWRVIFFNFVQDVSHSTKDIQSIHTRYTSGEMERIAWTVTANCAQHNLDYRSSNDAEKKQSCAILILQKHLSVWC